MRKVIEQFVRGGRNFITEIGLIATLAWCLTYSANNNQGTPDSITERFFGASVAIAPCLSILINMCDSYLLRSNGK